MEQGKRLKLFIILGVILVLLAIFLSRMALSGLGEHLLSGQQTAAEISEDIESPIVTKVLDGDTVEIADGRRIRYIGINAPPKDKCFAAQATAENSQLVLGKTIRLEKDTSNRDRSGHLLRYVYVEDATGQEIFLNDYLVRQGFARVLSTPPDLRFERQFNAAADEAKFQRRGLWGQCP
jgi:micrococcal nuclease